MLSAYVRREAESADEVGAHHETRTAITVAVPENGGLLSHDCYLHVLFIDCLVVSRRPGNVRRRSESTAGGNCRPSERRGATEERAHAGWLARVFSEELNFGRD